MDLSNGMPTILLSRSDALGDTILTLPVAGIIKRHFQGRCRIIFLGRTYTEALIRACENIDDFINYDIFCLQSKKDRARVLSSSGADTILHIFPRPEIATAAFQGRIPVRIGTSHRYYHWWTCNRLLNLGRKNSELHEAQLNTRLLRGIGIDREFSLEELSTYYGLSRTGPVPERFRSMLTKDKFNLVLHPKSHSSAREWSLNQYRELIRWLPPEQFRIFITGTEKEKHLLRDWLPLLPDHVIDLTGTMNLAELIAFLNGIDGLVAASTGPLHIAAALGKRVLGIYPPIRPMHAGRWAPLGKYASFMSIDRDCSECRNHPHLCHCINEVGAQRVYGALDEWFKQSR